MSRRTAGLSRALKRHRQGKEIARKTSSQLGFSQAVSEDIGGKRMVSKPTLPFDEQYRKNTLKAVTFAIETVQASATDMDFCLEQHPLLGADLPRYVLTWHPNRDLVCPLEYSEIDQGINRMGPWGLSTRVAKEFGAQTYQQVERPDRSSWRNSLVMFEWPYTGLRRR